MDDFERMLEKMLQSSREEIKNSNIQIDEDKLNNFKNIISELVNIRNEYAHKLPQLRTSTEKDILKFEYSKGGEVLHRGYYCPSPVLDLIVGNAKRGRLLKRKPDFGKYSYEYGFDMENRLIRVRGVNEFTTPDSRYDEEYLIYNKNIVIGLGFDNMGQINTVSRCTYDNGNIVKYEYCVCGLQEYADLYYEDYFYKNNIFSEVSVFNVTPQIELYDEQKYEVELDEEGKIVKLVRGFITNGVLERTVYNYKK
ncbi:hypothetical protein [Ammoniphilus sp. 3BR4]|uniref:hypothetical protein n=1 Tax=Ammoniphilus sp. 3BR4 TaxID=3158265 RepID=UPI0034679654